jgi:HEAT repeat
VEEFISTLVPAVQDALCDPSPLVREQSALAFQMMHSVVGAKAMEEVVPSLLRWVFDKQTATNNAVRLQPSVMVHTRRTRACLGASCMRQVMPVRP